MYGSDDDLTGGDFVDYIWVERLVMFMLAAEPERMREALARNGLEFAYLDSARHTSSFRQAFGFPFCTTWCNSMNFSCAWDTSHVHIRVCCHRLWPIAIEPPTSSA